MIHHKSSSSKKLLPCIVTVDIRSRNCIDGLMEWTRNGSITRRGRNAVEKSCPLFDTITSYSPGNTPSGSRHSTREADIKTASSCLLCGIILQARSVVLRKNDPCTSRILSEVLNAT